MTDEDKLFPVLSSAKIRRPNEAERRLPGWLANPTLFPAVSLHELSQNLNELSEFLDGDLIQVLKKIVCIDKVFPVQKCLIPVLTKQFEARQFRRPNDICVSSPTGSGKTLAYAIPIINYLKKSLSRSLRALVVLPSRDLAQQVHKTFHQLSSNSHIRCVLAASESADHGRGFLKQAHHRSNEEVDEDNSTASMVLGSKNTHFVVPDFVGAVDVLVATPGVLVDLVHNCHELSLKDLEILVIDEADRLMTSHKHDWLNALERSTYSRIVDCPCKLDKGSNKGPMRINDLTTPEKRRRICFSSNAGCTIRNAYQSKPLHKLLFSATLSSDPELLMHMNLFEPKLFLATKPSITGTKIRNSLGSRSNTPNGSPAPGPIPTPKHVTVNLRNELLTSSAIPEQLEEKMFITEAREKLFVIWYLFHELKFKKVICFTNQLQTSFRLCKFINEIDGVRAVEFSSNMRPETRQKILNEFKLGRVEVIVSTDLMARGMDLEGVDYVVSYDMPQSEIFYVHRMGRTARAGKKGTAITLVDTKQLVQFKRIVQLAHKESNSMRLSDVVEEMKVPHTVRKNATSYDLYVKTLENYEDKVGSLFKRRKNHRKRE